MFDQEEEAYMVKRAEEKRKYFQDLERKKAEEYIEDSVERRRKYFEEKSDYTPEIRIELQVNQ